MLQPFHPQGSSLRYAVFTGLCRPQSRSGRFGGSETSCACRESNHDSSVMQPAAWSLYHLRYSGPSHSYRRCEQSVIEKMFHTLFLFTSPKYFYAFLATSTLELRRNTRRCSTYSQYTVRSSQTVVVFQ